MLAFLQFSMSAFYEPAKRALTPLLVAPEELHLATTLDSFAWSLMGAVGASFGGWFASRFGTAACFALDACSYILAALCAFQLKVSASAGSSYYQAAIACGLHTWPAVMGEFIERADKGGWPASDNRVTHIEKS